MVSVLSACKGGTTPTTPSVTNPDGQPAEILQDLHPKKEIGRDMKILSDYAPIEDIHETNGDPVWDTEVANYLYAEEKFGVSLSYVTPAAGQVYSTLRMYLGSDGNEFDLVYSPHPNLGTYALLSEGGLTDLHNIQSMNLDRPWYNQSQVTNHTANGKLYLCVPDFTIAGQGLPAIIYNVERYKAMGFEEDLYELTKSGGWTIDKMISMVKAAETTSSGEGAVDTYALSYWKQLSYCMMYALGENILVKNTDGKFELGLDTNNLTTISEKLIELTSQDVVADSTNNNGFPDTTMWKAFESGNSLFMTMDIGSMNHWLRELEFDIHYLPLPKMTASADYRSVCASGFCGIPTIAKNYEESGTILDTMAIYGYERVKPAVFENILFGRLSKEPADYEMLNYIHSTKFYDLGFTIDEKAAARDLMMSVVFNATGATGKKAISTYLRANATKLTDIVDKANTLGVEVEE